MSPRWDEIYIEFVVKYSQGNIVVANLIITNQLPSFHPRRGSIVVGPI